MDVAQERREQRHARGDIGAVAIPAEQGADREAVAQVMWPGPAFRRARLEAGAADQIEPPEMRVAIEQSCAGRRDEERAVAWTGDQLVAATGVAGQGVDGARVQWDLPRLSELGLPDPQHTVVEVDVVTVEPERFPDAHTGDRQQSDQGLEGDGPQRRTELVSRGHEHRDVGIRVQIGRGPMGLRRPQPGRRHLMACVDGMEVTSERPHRREAMAPPFQAGVPGAGWPMPARCRS